MHDWVIVRLSDRQKTKNFSFGSTNHNCTFDFPTPSDDDCKAVCRLNEAQINAL